MSFWRMAKMHINSEIGIEKYAFYMKLRSKKDFLIYGHLLCILRLFWPKNGSSIGGTSHVSIELIHTFLESGEQGEWD